MKSAKNESLNTKIKNRLLARPYYAFLYARNIVGGRLPEKLEEVFVKDPHSAYLYAKHVMKGRLPEFVHNALVINCFEKTDDRQFVIAYLKDFCKEE